MESFDCNGGKKLLFNFVILVCFFNNKDIYFIDIVYKELKVFIFDLEILLFLFIDNKSNKN